MNEKSNSNIPLVEVLDALRKDLKTAQDKSDPSAPLIIEEIEVELQVVVTKNIKSDTEAKLEVLNVFGLGGLEGKLNLNGSWAKASTQKIKLKLSAGVVDPETKKMSKMKVVSETHTK